jgi:hypothetical protein
MLRPAHLVGQEQRQDPARHAGCQADHKVPPLIAVLQQGNGGQQSAQSDLQPSEPKKELRQGRERSC